MRSQVMTAEYESSKYLMAAPCANMFESRVQAITIAKAMIGGAESRCSNPMGECESRSITLHVFSARVMHFFSRCLFTLCRDARDLLLYILQTAFSRSSCTSQHIKASRVLRSNHG